MHQNEFLQIINPFRDKLFRFAKRLLVSKEEAEDACQEVIIKLWKGNWKAYRNIEAMAMTMTKNYCLDQLKAKRSTNLSISHSNYSDGVSIEKNIENKDNLHQVEKIIALLPTQQKMIVQLREIEQMEFSEIAKLLDMNETAVRVALSRARKTIKEKIEATHNYGITAD